MTLSLTQQIKSTFDLASLRHEASKKLNGDEWKGYQTIRKRHDAERRFVQRNYGDEYKSRVETVRAELLRQRGAKTLDHKPRFAGIDRFDANALNRQSHRTVQNQHQSELSQIDTREREAIETLIKQAEQRQAAPATPYNKEKIIDDKTPSIFRNLTRKR